MARSHPDTSDGAAKALASLKAMRDTPRWSVTHGLLAAKGQPCPDCGAVVTYYWTPNNLDPGDVDPRAMCTNCDWGY